jgi:ankyrin repeat protein
MWCLSGLGGLLGLCLALSALAQVPPSAREVAEYSGLFRAVAEPDMELLSAEIKNSKDIDKRDDYGRSALHIATYYGNHRAMKKLAKAGANTNALEQDSYDIVTIAAVADDLKTMNLALQLGCRSDNVTSRYDGTALIAAAHLGHVEIVDSLIRAEAPLDHINNLHWTALIEAIVLGDGGEQHTATLKLLVDAGADVNLADGSGRTPLTLARQHGYTQMIEILLSAGAS